MDGDDDNDLFYRHVAFFWTIKRSGDRFEEGAAEFIREVLGSCGLIFTGFLSSTICGGIDYARWVNVVVLGARL